MNVSMHRLKCVLPAAAACALSLIGVLHTTSAAAQDLTGAGSTFINPIMQTWIAEYRKTGGASINYQSIGSGGGISGLINKTVDFAGSDAPMNPQELAEAKGAVLHLPVVIGTVAVAYNIPGVPAGLHLTGPILTDIYLGKITRWNDPQLEKLNPGVKLPASSIFVAHRSDGSGTTFIFTDYLAKISGEWKNQVGAGKSVRWPVGLGGKGSEGVAGLIRTHENSIGYVELAYATQNRIAFATLQNAKGRFVEPSVESGSEAAAGVSMPGDFRVSITNTSAAGGYPISGFSWLIVYRDSTKGPQVKKFLDWVLTNGQSYTKALQYAPVPPSVRQREQAQLSSIR